MYAIDVMVEEHENIIRMLKVIRTMCCQILDGGDVCVEDFRDVIDFTRNYSDTYHHGKEEKFLFNEMVARMGRIAENLVTHGMLVEHDFGRNYCRECETALNLYEEHPTTEYKLDVITMAMSYAHLLQLHAEKENSVVYTFAMRELPEEVCRSIDEKVREYEDRESSRKTRQTYLGILHRLMKKYQIEAAE